MGKQVHISSPASTANLGPGFDCLGLALSLYYKLSVTEEEGDGLEIEAVGEGAGGVPRDEGNVVYRGICRSFELVGSRPRRLNLKSDNEIPLAAGLGSSAAAYLAGLAAGMLLSGQQVDREALIQLGVEHEGHGDNVVPCVSGGFTVCAVSDAGTEYVRLEPPEDLFALLTIPDFSLQTEKARSVLPESVTLLDAVHNQARAALLVAALSEGRLEHLKTAMQDRLHQSARATLIPGMDAVIAAAVDAGALGAALSGAGPTVLALTRREIQEEGAPGSAEILEAMREAWSKLGIESRTMDLEVDRTGLMASGHA